MNAVDRSHWRDRIDDAARAVNRTIPYLLACALGVALRALLVPPICR